MRVNGRKQKHGWRCRWKSRETGAGTCGLPETSRIQLNYIRGLNRSRISRYVGSLLNAQVQELNVKLRIHLGL